MKTSKWVINPNPNPNWARLGFAIEASQSNLKYYFFKMLKIFIFIKIPITTIFH